MPQTFGLFVVDVPLNLEGQSDHYISHTPVADAR